jgi:hypothetical protein
MFAHASHRLAGGRRRIVSAVTIAAAVFGIVATPAPAQNSESAPAAAAPMKSKLKTPSGGTVTVKVTNWREADLVGAAGGGERLG